MLARADAAHALAEEAAKKGNATLQEAHDILKNLRGVLNYIAGLIKRNTTETSLTREWSTKDQVGLLLNWH